MGGWGKEGKRKVETGQHVNKGRREEKERESKGKDGLDRETWGRVEGRGRFRKVNTCQYWKGERDQYITAERE